MMVAPIEIGRVVAGKYQIVRLLGQGSMGAVWVAHHRTLGEEVALKVLTQAPAGGGMEDPSSAAARFRFEAQVAARLSRKTRHIVRVTDHGEEDGLAYLVMELLEGQTLERRLMVRDMTIADVRNIVTQVARALEEARAEALVHRDLKPANIFLARDEEGRLLVKLLDFGIARTMHTRRVTVPFATGCGLVWGTAGYMGPEQARAAPLDPRWDLWALATIAYEGLTGELPIPGTEPEELMENLHARRFISVHERRPDLPTGMAAFFDRAFAQNIEHRYDSASDLAIAFDRAIDSGRADESPKAPAFTARTADNVFMALDSPPRSSGSGRAVWRGLDFFAAMVVLGVAIAGAAWRRPRGSPGKAAIAVSPVTLTPENVGTGSAESKQLPSITPEQPPSTTQAPTSPSPHAMPPPTQRPRPLLVPGVSTPAPAASPRKPIDKSEVF